jgi:hypothetical protein
MVWTLLDAESASVACRARAPRMGRLPPDGKETLTHGAQTESSAEFVGGAMFDAIGWLTVAAALAVATAFALVAAQFAYLISHV